MCVVVVLPLDPVMPIIGDLVYQLANSISLTIGIFFLYAILTIFESTEIPGERIHKCFSDCKHDCNMIFSVTFS